ncbi:MAG: 5'-methylthioadenosine phosphorylase [Thiobacillus sp. SCN 63-374]|uniref:S-methyl-5'-thioinosine phosphorylase n=1 Tax=Thiobacillus sp. SCN 63-57 TaxID=1660145 RepID=UPI00086887CC|nr:S-methyl-5'-thioinosine phosphorylase [Thiobacillus sp. SCN 63-57]ODU40722.1 MAG: 5'-methylthioadenosine phosphorylase [Thiobacillus sp. SCN 63-374]ODV02844.1 MAG: 5'-methylthioadenosine phosphorylase [Thiobacillus sp. SCN 63-57]
MLGIIGGTGLTQLANLEITHRQVARTPYGEPSGALTFGRICGQEVIFLARHGYGHTIPPHEVNYRANLWALKEHGVDRVVSVATVGGIHPELIPGTLAIPDQIIDYTHSRAATYFAGSDKPVTHLDFTTPYCGAMRTALLQAATRAGISLRDGGVYGAVQGPRLETAAEINRMERDGADMVGMTGMPEAYLARELALCYATVGAVVNYAAGRGLSAEGIQMGEIQAVLGEVMLQVRHLLEQLVTDDAAGLCTY